MVSVADTSLLVEKYRNDLSGIGIEDVKMLKHALQKTCDWTPIASAHLIALVRNNGTFVLRNALAVAIALRVEDGELGL